MHFFFLISIWSGPHCRLFQPRTTHLDKGPTAQQWQTIHTHTHTQSVLYMYTHKTKLCLCDKFVEMWKYLFYDGDINHPYTQNLCKASQLDFILDFWESYCHFCLQYASVNEWSSVDSQRPTFGDFSFFKDFFMTWNSYSALGWLWENQRKQCITRTVQELNQLKKKK